MKTQFVNLMTDKTNLLMYFFLLYKMTFKVMGYEQLNLYAANETVTEL